MPTDDEIINYIYATTSILPVEQYAPFWNTVYGVVDIYATFPYNTGRGNAFPGPPQPSYIIELFDFRGLIVPPIPFNEHLLRVLTVLG